MNQRDFDKLTLKREALMGATRPPDERRQLSVILGIALGCMALMIVLPAFIIAVFGKPQPARAPTLGATSPVTPGLAWPTQLDPDTPTGTALAPSARLAVDGDGWLGVAASPGLPPVMAVWSSSQLFVSRDDGRSFRQILGGPGHIGGAAIDSDGQVFVVRDRKRLGFQNPFAGGPGVWWRDLPFAGETLQLVAGGRWLGWLALAEDSERGSQVVLALSDDGGVTWRTQSIAEHADDALMRIENDGTIHLVLLREDAAAPTAWRRLRGHVDGRPMQQMPWPSSTTDAWGLGHGGFAYAIASECASEGNDICAVELHDQFISTRLTTEGSLHMGSNGLTTLAASGSQLLRFDGHAAAVVDEHAPAGISAFAVDGHGRAVGVVGQHLVRWSPRHGWRVLFTPDGQIHYATP